MRRRVQLTVLATAVGLSVAVLPPAGAIAQQAALPAGVTSTIQVVADGLNAPRGLVYDHRHHRVLVAEAGILAGDTGPCGKAERGLPFCLGSTGSIFQYAESGDDSGRIVTGLPSIGLQAGPPVVIGLHDLSLRGDRLTAVFGLLGNKAFRDSLGPGAAALGQAVTIGESGRPRPFGDIVGFIDRFYPGHVEADPYGVATGRFGTVVANAGGPGSKGNDLLQVKRDGTVTELAAFPARPLPGSPTTIIDSVPTTVEQGPDGAFYVGELTGAPFTPGVARVWRVVPGQPATVYADGFTLINDIAFDEQGRLVVLETAQDNPFDTTQNGTLIRVERDGRRTVLASAGMLNPGGVALAGDGVFYVTTESASGGGIGQLLKIRVHG